MYNTEVKTITKSLPLLRWNTCKSLIFSYSAYFSRIFRKKIKKTTTMQINVKNIQYTENISILYLQKKNKKRSAPKPNDKSWYASLNLLIYLIRLHINFSPHKTRQTPTPINLNGLIWCSFFLTSSLKKHVFYNWWINIILYLCVT